MKYLPLVFSLLLFSPTSHAEAQEYDLLVEDFSQTQFPPPGWTMEDIAGNGGWVRDRDKEVARVPLCKYNATRLITPPLDFSTQSQWLLLKYEGAYEGGCGFNTVIIEANVQGSGWWWLGMGSLDGMDAVALNELMGARDVQLSFTYLADLPPTGQGGDVWTVDNITVQGGNDPGGGGGGGTDPLADFTFSPQEGDAPLRVQFVDQSTGGPIASYSWSFGDGASSTQANPSHLYTSQGTYFPSLTVVSTNGASSTSTSSSPVTVHNSNNGGGTSGGGGGDWDTANDGEGTYDGGLLGAAIANIHDITGDGICDFAVGSPQAPNSSGTICGAVMIHKGGNGNLIREILAPQNPNGNFGASVTGVHEIDASGTLGVLIGAPTDSATGRAYLHNASTGALVHVLQPAVTAGITSFGASVQTGPDASGDGIPDLLIGAPDADTNGSTDN